MSATNSDPLVLSCMSEGKNYLADFQVRDDGISSKGTRVRFSCTVVRDVLLPGK